jgi:type IV pilus assembly protein PilM
MLPDMDEDGQLHMIAVAASKELISSHQLMAKRAHIKLESIVPACETIFRFLKNKIASVPKGETPQDFAILDLGDTSVKLHFFTRGQYEVTRSMDYGISSAVQRIAEESGQDVHISRVNLETNGGNVLSEPYLEDVFSDLASRVMRVLNFYNFNNRNNTLEDLYYYGGGALVEPLMNDIRDSIPLNLKSISELIPVKHKLTEEQILIGAQAIGMTM